MDSNGVYQTSSLIIREPEVEDFTWNFKISARSRIQKNIESVTFGGFSFSGLQFKTGFLAEVEHKWGLTFYSNQINVHMSLQSRDRTHRYTLKPSSLELISLEQLKIKHDLIFQKDENTMAPRVLWTAFWINSDLSWDDSVDMVRVVFRVSRDISGTCLQTLVSQECALRNATVLKTAKDLNTSEFFMNPHLSDVTIHCKGQTFPGHRLLLSCRSPVLSQMFRTEMREKKEGLLIIEDMEPEVLKQLLQFVYCGNVDLEMMPDKLCKDLFKAADKYDLEALKVLCEHETVKKIGKGNCLEMYATADLYGARMMKEHCREMIRLNKREIFRDREAFKTFAANYPDLAFELFHSQN